MLLGKNLHYRLESWEQVYVSLTREGADFTEGQDYSCTLLVRVLLDVYGGRAHNITLALLKALMTTQK